MKTNKNRWSKNAKLNALMLDIERSLMESPGIVDIRRYVNEFPEEPDCNIVQHGNVLAYYDQVRELYKQHGYSVGRYSDNRLWTIYKWDVGEVARRLAREYDAAALVERAAHTSEIFAGFVRELLEHTNIEQLENTMRHFLGTVGNTLAIRYFPEVKPRNAMRWMRRRGLVNYNRDEGAAFAYFCENLEDAAKWIVIESGK